MRFPAPNGDVYILDTYEGCRECGTAAGVTLYRFTTAEAAEWCVDDASILPVDNMGTGVSVVDPRILKQMMLEWLAGYGGEYDAEGAIQDGIDECFLAAAMKTVGEWDKHDRRRAEEGDAAGERHGS